MDEVTQGEAWHWHHDPDARFGELRVSGVGRKLLPRGEQQAVDRCLDRLSLSLVCRGCGSFSDTGQQRRFSAGDVLVLMPGVHHRYHSDDTRGWEAIWCFIDASPLMIADAALRSGPVRVGLDSKVARCFRDLLRLARDPGRPRRLLTVPALELLCELSLRLRPPAPASGGDGVERAIARLGEHPQRSWDLPALAEHCGISYSLLRQQLRQRTGLSPQRYLQAIRCDRACELLGGAIPVGEVALRVGFSDPFHFSRVFRRVVGCSPSAFREGLR
jgi:AraC-like DNA-binding protein